MINEYAAVPLPEPSLQARFREQLARESRVVKVEKLPRQPLTNVTLLRASWLVAAGRFFRPA